MDIVEMINAWFWMWGFVINVGTLLWIIYKIVTEWEPSER